MWSYRFRSWLLITDLRAVRYLVYSFNTSSMLTWVALWHTTTLAIRRISDLQQVCVAARCNAFNTHPALQGRVKDRHVEQPCSRLQLWHMLQRRNISFPRADGSQREYIHSPPGFLATYQLLVRLSACRTANPICTECHQRHCTYVQWLSEDTSTANAQRPDVWFEGWTEHTINIHMNVIEIEGSTLRTEQLYANSSFAAQPDGFNTNLISSTWTLNHSSPVGTTRVFASVWFWMTKHLRSYCYFAVSAVVKWSAGKCTAEETITYALPKNNYGIVVFHYLSKHKPSLGTTGPAGAQVQPLMLRQCLQNKKALICWS